MKTRYRQRIRLKTPGGDPALHCFATRALLDDVKYLVSVEPGVDVAHHVGFVGHQGVGVSVEK